MTAAGDRDDLPVDPAEVPHDWVPFDQWAAEQEPPPAEPDAAEDGRNQQTSSSTAMVRAATWSVPPAVVMLISAAMTASSARAHFIQSWTGSHAWVTSGGRPDPPPYLLWLVLIGGACWTICTVAELRYARRLGEAYPPLGPWARIPATAALWGVRRAAGGLDRKLGAGGGCLALLALAAAGPVIILAWWAVTAGAAPLWIIAVGAATMLHLSTVI